MSALTERATVYLISGPLGVGKSTASKRIADTLNPCALIEGDLLLHLYKGDKQPPWEDRLHLAWLNIRDVAMNLLRYGIDVVIDFVVEEELDWFRNQIAGYNVELRYAVLHADPAVLLSRLQQRGDAQYIDRSLFLRNKLTATPSNEPYLLNTDGLDPERIAEAIMTDDRFRLPE